MMVKFNETFASLNPNQPDFAVLWHEAISGRNAEDVASFYLKIIERSGAPEITFWTDNCSGRNKNWFLFTALAQCVNQGWGPNLFRMKYLEKGHTFYACRCYSWPNR